MARKIKKIKQKPFGALIKEADRVFSLWVRKREPLCVQCHTTKNLTCGHLISRRKMAVRWDELNCHTQCWGCNSAHRYWPEKYTSWFVNRYGEELYLKLCNNSTVLRKWRRDEIEEIIDKYS